MAIDTLRATQILSGADALLPDAPSFLAPGAASGLGTPSLGDPTGDLSGTLPDLTGTVAGIANGPILSLHQTLETLADANGLIGTVHGITNLGETVGLGKIGGSNLLTTVLDAPAALAGGDTSILGHVVPDATAIGGAAEQLVTGAASDAGLGSGLTSPLTGVTGAAGALSSASLTSFANDTILDLHTTLEQAADMGGLPGTVHGITGLGEAIGLGKIGGANLLTDLLDTPQGLLSGDTSSLTHLPADLGAIAGAAENLVSGITADLASGAFLSNPVGNTVALASGLATLPVESIANGAINSIHATLEMGIDPVAPSTIHGITSLGNSIGLGELGGSNLLTDALGTPGALLAGDTTPLTHLPTDLGMIGSAVAALPGDVGADLGHGLLSNPKTGGGLLGGDLPGAGIVSTATMAATDLVGNATSAGGLGDVGQAANGALGGAQGGLLQDVTHVPGDILAGAGEGASPLPGDAGTSLGSLGTILGAASGDATHALGGIGDLGGGAGGLASTVSGLTGGLSGGSGSHDIVTVAVGPQTPTSGLGLNVLSNGGGSTHLVDTHVGSAGAPAPTIANISILPDSIHVPSTGGAGLDALSGLASAVSPAAATGSGASALHGLDLGIAHLDVPVAVAHADPLHGLAHAV